MIIQFNINVIIITLNVIINVINMHKLKQMYDIFEKKIH